MSGSRLGRGRSGRLAVYGGCGVVVLLLVYLYRAAASEMARLKDLHVQCAHQQEALAAQLQVIFEYKVRLEKSLAEEKSSNAAVKQELQQRASREKTLRDKDSIEAMQRYNSLQQSYKLLQTEHQDRQEECKKQEKQALEEKHKLESALQDKSKSMEQLKNKYMQLETNKTRLEDKYNELEKSTANMDSTIEHYKKITAQLETELKIAKDACKVDPLSNPSEPRQLPDDDANDRLKSNDQMQRPSQSSKEKEKGEKAKEKEEQQQQSQQQQQQVSSPNDGEANPRPIGAPRIHHTIEHNPDDALSNEEPSNIGFAQRNGNIVPIGSNDLTNDNKENREANEPQKSLPIPYNFRDRYHEEHDEIHDNEIHPQIPKGIDKIPETGDDDQHKQVIQEPPSQNEDQRGIVKKSSSHSPKDNLPIPKPQNSDGIPRPDEQPEDQLDPADPRVDDDELSNLEEKVAGILNQQDG